jgi:hypothetical protein
MAELIDAVASWQTLLLAVGVFGFAPNVVLRLLLLAYPKNDPRRRELIAELKAMKWFERPFWVADQFGTALFDGLPRRKAARRAKKMRRELEAAQANLDRALKVRMHNMGVGAEYKDKVPRRTIPPGYVVDQVEISPIAFPEPIEISFDHGRFDVPGPFDETRPGPFDETSL